MQKLDLTRRVEELKKFCEDTENGFKENQAALEKKNAEVHLQNGFEPVNEVVLLVYDAGADVLRCRWCIASDAPAHARNCNN